MSWGSVGKDGTVFIDFLKPAINLWRRTPGRLKVLAGVVVVGAALTATGVYVFRKATK